ncbi:MAG: DUF3107 domain-containing protein [Micrococcaceae bacterium]
MEIRIGIQHVAREIVLETEAGADEVNEKVQASLSRGEVLELTDKKGKTLLVPAAGIGYVEVGDATARPVGFAAQ